MEQITTLQISVIAQAWLVVPLRATRSFKAKPKPKMTAAQTETSDTSAAPKKSSQNMLDAVDKKVANNQLADPSKLISDSIAKAQPVIDQVAASKSDSSTTSPFLSSPSLLPPILPVANNPFLTFDNSIYDGNACKVGPYSADLFDLSDPNSIFSGKYDMNTEYKNWPGRQGSDNGQAWGSNLARGAARRELVGKVADHTFDLVFDEPEDKAKTKFDVSAATEAATLLKDHKPGDDWAGENGSRYKALPDGGVLRKDANGDVEFSGKDGKSFQRHGKDETWSLHGETIEKHVDDQGHETYLKRFSDGTTTKIVEDKDIKAIHELENLTVTQHRTRLSESRQAFSEAHNGVNQHTDGQDYVKDDGNGNRLRKDSQHDYALLKTKDGKFYAIKSGHVYEFDMEHHRFSHDEVPADKIPPSLKKNADGTFTFGTASLSAKNELTDSLNDVDFHNRDSHIHARCHGKDVDLSVDHGNENVKVGDRNSTYDSVHDKLAVTDHGHPNMTFDYQSRTLHSEGITFTANNTNIEGQFNIDERSGDIRFTDNTSWASSSSSYDDEYEAAGHSRGASSEIHATVNEALALSAQINSPGGQEGAIAQLRAILGKLDGITGGGVEVQAAKASAKETISGQIDRAQEISSVNARLFGAGESNATIAEAIARRGPGTSDDFIVRETLAKDSA